MERWTNPFDVAGFVRLAATDAVQNAGRLAALSGIAAGLVALPFGCSVGAPGLLMSLSSTNPGVGIGFFQSGVEGDPGTLLAQQAELVAVEVALEAAAGDTGAHMDGSFEKMLHRLLDERFPLRMLPPDSAVPEDGYLAFRSWLEATLPNWAPDPS